MVDYSKNPNSLHGLSGFIFLSFCRQNIDEPNLNSDKRTNKRNYLVTLPNCLFHKRFYNCTLYIYD